MPINKNDFINYPGEMLPEERRSMFQWIVKINPSAILEVGTGTGASTFFMSEALKSINSNGVIHTCDPNSNRINKALLLEKNVVYYQQTSDQCIRNLKLDSLDFIFFDGPEIEDVAINDLKFLEEKIKPGCHFAMHDWETEKRLYDGGISIKSKKIRPYMENSERWTELEYLEGITSDQSVGLCLYKFNG